jgi:hypothetical protein
MLPLLQLHRSVQPSTNLDPLASGSVQLDPNFSTFHHLSRLSRNPASLLPHSNSSERAFPIRTSQATIQPPQGVHRRATAALVPLHFADRPEHQLRRKTPNGTIDAGYDGSPAQLAPGPPPLKHMIVPAAPNLALPGHSRSPGEIITRHRHAQQTIPVEVVPLPRRRDGHFDPLDQRSRPRAHFVLGDPQNGGEPDQPSRYHPLGTDHRFLNAQDSPAVLRTAYQLHTRPTAFHARAYCPPPPIFDEPPRREPLSHHPGQQNLQRSNASPSRGNGRHTFTRAALTGNYASTSSGLGRPQTNQQSGESYVFSETDSVQASPLGLESLSIGPGANDRLAGPSEDTVARSRFREKALTYAHRTYMDLLAHLNHARKHGKSTAGPHASPKVLVYPKLPKHLIATSSLVSQQSTHGVFANLAPRIHHQNSGGIDLKMTSSSNCRDWDRQTPSAGRSSHGTLGPAGLYSNTNQAPTRRSSTPQKPYYPTIYASTEHERISPISGARSSLEMLNHMCEQSGWKWVDGMLLGGCLHYGLEHYEEALEWFSRIMALDSRYVDSESLSWSNASSLVA